ncbi:MAG TPA: hypothetical protein VMM36_19990 [Opitutaceae bacterium]|nr:hypothetical protein [Opitutaceae bacterium]
MYPQQDLIQIAGQKAALRHSIALHRGRCAEAAERAARPVALADRAWASWRKLSPIVQVAAVPLGIAATRVLLPRYKLLRKLVRWSPLVITAMRAIGTGRKGVAAGQSAGAQPSQSTEN